MHRQATCLPLLGMVAALMLPLGANAQDEPYYTWIDENGVVNFSQKNPKDVDAVYVNRGRRIATEDTDPAMNRRPGKAAAAEEPAPEAESGEAATAEAAPAGSEVPDAQIDAQMAAERAAVEAEIAKAKANNCAAGKRNLARLEAYARIRVRNEDGSEHVLTDDEKAQRINNAKQMIADNC